MDKVELKQTKPSNAQILIRLLLGLGIIVVCLSTVATLYREKQYEQRRQQPVWQSAQVRYEAIDHSSPFQQLWVKSNVFLNRLLAIDETVIYTGGLNAYQAFDLISLDLLTGQKRWQIEEASHTKPGFVHSRENVYVSDRDQITAYNPQSGDIIWERDVPEVRNVLDISASETEIFVRATPGLPFFIFEAETGFLEASFSNFNSENLPILRIEDEVVYRISSTDRFQAVSLQDKISLWEVKFRNDLAGIRFTDDIIFILVNELSPWQIYAIERATGEILWKSAENIVSDVVIAEDTLYALTAKSQLIGINTHTGEVIGKLDFKPAFLELEREESYNTLDYSLYLAAVDDKVLVYIGSGRQLFAFRFVPN